MFTYKKAPYKIFALGPKFCCDFIFYFWPYPSPLISWLVTWELVYICNFAYKQLTTSVEAHTSFTIFIDAALIELELPF